MTDAYATIKVLSSQQSRDQLNLVVNQVGAPAMAVPSANQLQQVVERFVQSPAGQSPKLNFLGDVPLDSSVREAVQNASCCWSCIPAARRHKALFRWPPVCCLASPLDSALLSVSCLNTNPLTSGWAAMPRCAPWSIASTT